MSAAPGARFADEQRVLSLFARGASGRPLHLEPAADGRPRLVHAARDGYSLGLPAQIDDFASLAHNRGAYRARVLHQVGYLEFGTLEFRLRRVLPKAPPPPAGSTELLAFFASAPRPALLRRLFVALEDWRIDHALRRRYPGAAADLERVRALALARRPDLATLRPLAAVLEGLERFSLGADPAALLAADASGALTDILAVTQPLAAAAADVHDSARAALAAYARLTPATTTHAWRAQGKALGGGGPARDASLGGPPDADDLAQAEAGDGGGGFRGHFPAHLQVRERRGAAHGEHGGDLDFDDAEVPDLYLDDDSGDATAEPPGTPAALPPRAAAPAASSRRPTASDGAAQSFYYDEWNYRDGAYLPAWCRLLEYRLQGRDHEFIGEVRRRHGGLLREVRRQFGVIRPEALRHVHGVVDGDDLDLDRVIAAAVDRRTGQAPDDGLYLARQRARREVCAAFLVDLSGSTGFPLPDKTAAADTGEPGSPGYLYGGGIRPQAPLVPPRRVIDIAKEALALMCDALQAHGDSHAVYGFSGDGREHVEFHVAKEFRQPWRPATWAALAAMKPLRATRTGPAIRHAVGKLLRQAEPTRVLIVVSDGYPQDRDYGPDRDDKAYGLHDTAQALREAARHGIQTFCIAIDPAGHDYMRAMCAADRYLVVDDIEALPAQLAKVYQALTGAVPRRPAGAPTKPPPRPAQAASRPAR